MTRSLTLSDAVWPGASRAKDTAKWLVRNLTLAVVFSAIIGLLAHFQIKLGFTPVPITGQTLGVLLTGALLGSRLGIATILLYIAEGYAGLPVFASAGGVTSLGYLVGFVPAAGVVGMLAERRFDRNPFTTALMMAAGSCIIYLCGVTWLAHFVGGVERGIMLGVFPFLPGDVIKALIASALLPLGWSLVGRNRQSGDAA